MANSAGSNSVNSTLAISVVQRAAERLRLGVADASDLQVLAAHGQRLPAGAREKFEEQLAKAVKEQEAKQRAELARGAASEIDGGSSAAAAAAAAVVVAKQAASLAKLTAELASGTIVRPQGKGPDSKTKWEEVVVAEDPNDTLMIREVKTKNGEVVVDRSTGRAVVDVRTKAEVDKVEVQKVVAKAVGLPLQKAGVTGRERSEMIRRVVDQAMVYAEQGAPSPAQLAAMSPKERAEARAAVAVASQVGDITGGSRSVDVQAVQAAFMDLAQHVPTRTIDNSPGLSLARPLN